MSQKPSASSMAMVMSKTLAIIGNLRETYSCLFRDSPSSLGAGRQPESNGGPPAARLGCQGPRSTGRDVAHVGRRSKGEREKWRAEVGPMLPGAGPRALPSRLGGESSFERLVFAEIGDGHPERIDRDQFVGDICLENEDKIRGVEIAFQFAMVGGRVVDHVEIDASAVRRVLHLFERDFLHVDVDLGGGSVGKEFTDDVVLAVGVENAVGELAVEEEERLREIVLNRVAVSAVIERAKLREKIFRFGILRFVFKVVVVDGLGAAQIVDADDERTEVLERANRPQINQRQRYANHGEQREGNLEIGVRHHGISTRFEVKALRVMECVMAIHQSSLAAATAAAAGASNKLAEEP